MHTSTKAFLLRSLVFTAATFRWLIVGVAWVVGVTVQAQTTGVSRDLFRGVSTNDNTYATTVVFTNLVPSANSITPDFETPSNLGDAFGDRLRAFILPSVTGNHVFGIASDEWSDLFLSDGEFPAGRTRIAFVNEATAPREYTREPNQQSAPVFLEAGRRYYIEAVRKEGRGPDHLSVRWIMPDGSLEEPIPGRSGSVFRLLPYRTNTINVPSLLGAFPTNLTLAEGREARLSAAAANNSPISYQWQLNGVDIPGATTSSFVINPVEVLPNNGQRYRCILSNSVRTTNTAEVLLTVLADLTPPTVAQILYTQSTRLIVRFSEPLLPASATRADQYVLDGGVSVLSAVMESDSSVVLTTSPMTYGSTYKLSVSGIQDRIRSPNTITPGTQVSFLAVEFNPSDIGAVTTPSTSTLVPGGFDVRVAGRDIGGSSDQFAFQWQLRTGDFDVKVRVQSLSDALDAWAKAGLMARATLASNSAYAMTVSSPGVQGSYFGFRTLSGGPSSASGTFPNIGPNVWLRLQRNGNRFSGFAGFDGSSWSPLGSTTVGLPTTVYLGMATASRITNQVVTAQFREWADVESVSQPEVFAQVEPPGPSSRTGPISITEIMFQNTLRPDLTNSLEYLEIYNSNPYFEDLSGYRLRGDINYDFPQGSVMPAGAYWVIARDPQAVRTVYGLGTVLGPFTGSLRSSGVVRLEDKLKAVMLEVPYLNRAPWPVAADGSGHSLVLSKPSYGERLAEAWGISDVKGGSPGRFDAPGVEPQRGVVINEFLANSDAPREDFVELYNRRSHPVDVSGAWLSDSLTTNFFRIPDGTILAPGGFVSFTQSQLGFGLSAGGEAIYLQNRARTRVLDAIRFDAQRPDLSSGRSPDGSSEFHPLTSTTPGARNATLLVHDIAINEIMYKPITDDDDDGYVELHNHGTLPVNLSGWRFVSGIGFEFPAGTVLDAGGYLVVARNRTNLLARYPGVLTAQNTFGNYSGRPTRDLRRIALAMRLTQITTNTSGVVSTNHTYPIVDEVTFGRGGRWGQWANGDGSSLELRDPKSNKRLAYNWGDSDETRKAPWTLIEATGLVDNGAPQDGTANRLEVTMLGMGECLLDDVEVFAGNAQTPRLSNGTFESGLGQWTPQGNHISTRLETAEGYNSANSLRVRASARGDTGANRIRVPLTGVVAENQPCVFRARVRWLRGWPEVILRLEGNGFELAGRMEVPMNLGTPGARNSIAVNNAPPAISEVRHTPVLPAGGEPVLVTARAHDSHGVGRLDLAYRLDPTTNIAIVPMKDDGSGGDALAADGIYSAFIPAQATGTLVGFHIQAADASPAEVSVLFPDDAPVRECLVRFGEPTPASGYATYHYYLTARNVATWINRPALSNERVEGTFVYGNFRAIYNISGKYSGSPYHQGFNSPVTDPCHFSLELPVDDMLLGTENFNKLHAPGNSAFDDGALQREQTAYWLMRAMDLPYNYRRFHAMYVNGIRKGSFMEDTQTPGSDIVDQRWPDDNDGHLYKLQPWFEFDDITVTAGASAGFNNVSWCTLMNFYTGPLRDQKKIARYRYNYLTRAANLTANDYTNVWDLTDAANTPAGGNYIGNMRQIVDMEQWLKTFAVQHGVGNWDSFGNRNSQNMYGYKPERGRWQLMTWDFNIVLGNSGSDGPTGDDIFQHNFADTAMLRIYQTPEFRRIYLRFIKELAEGPFRDPQLNALMIAKHAEFVNSGQTASNPSEIWGWLGQRRDYLLSQVRSYLTNFSVSTPASYETNASAVVVRGSAPLEVAQITVNGQAVPVVWFALPGAATISTQWRVTMPLLSGTNEFIFEGRDASGNVLSGMTITNVIRNVGEPIDPRGWVVFNEIMYNPPLPDASYLEIRNRSSSETFDLSGWRVEGVDYTFPTGSVLLPDQHLLLARERVKFIRAFPGGFPVFGEYNGGLANEGEVLSLIRPGANPANDLLVDRVRFDSALPWSQAANGGGVSLQLVDDAEDNSRSSNWADASRQEWQKVSVTSTNRGSILMFFMGLPGKVHIDDVSLTDSSGADVVINGSFESPLPGTWTVTTNYSATVVTSEVARSGSRSLWIDSRGSGGPTTNGSIWQVTLPILTNGTYTLTYHYLPTVTAQTIAARTFPLGGLSVSNSVSPMLVTPGFANNRTADLPEYPPLWLNEILPYNRNGAADAQGEREAWVELQNSGATTISLEGWFLSDDYGDLTKWSFPPNSSIQPREFKLIWLDGEPEAGSSMDIHTSIVPAITNGSIALSRRVGGRVQVVDYLNYRGLGADESYGSYPDAQPFYRQRLARPTPRAGNDATPPAVRINEWLADNSAGLTNPASGRFSDWFEIYNPADTAADLTGFFLSENPNNRNQFAIPPGTTVPARGYLLVWADNLPEANGPGVTDLHVNFALNRRNGGSLLIFSPSGEVVDRISFGTQTNDISMGRFPDGAESLRFMVRPTPRAANVVGSSENSPPTLAAMPDRNIAEETRLFFSATASDSENLPSDLVFSLDPGSPPGASILPDGRFRWRPTEAQGPGVYDIRVRVSDLGTPPLSDTKAFRVTVAEVNKPPLFDLRPQYGKTGQLLTFNTANDPDLPRQSLIYELLPDVPSGVQLDPASGLVSWTPSIDQAGRHVIRVKATDSGVPILSASYDYPVEIVRATQSLITLQLSIDQQGRVVIMARGPIGSRYQLESSTSIASPLWTAAGGVVTSIAEQTQLIDAQPGAAVKYYRVREIEP